MFNARAGHRLVESPAYPKILQQYNALLKRDGRVNALKFYEQVVLPELPGYSKSSWYFFLKRFKTAAGLPINPQLPGDEVTPVAGETLPSNPLAPGEVEQHQLQQTMMGMQEATTLALALAMNISVKALQDIIKDPSKMSEKERAKLFALVMKSQDSRVKAIGGVRADNREQERFDRMLANGAFA